MCKLHCNNENGKKDNSLRNANEKKEKENKKELNFKNCHIVDAEEKELDFGENRKGKLHALRDEAVEVAKKSPHNYHQHGALLVRNGRVICSAFNDYTFHAEKNLINNYYLLCFKEGKGKER